VDQYEWFSPTSDSIEDKKTGMVWQRGASAMMDFDDAKLHCADPDAGPGWRLPTVKELLTLVDEQPRPVYANGKLTYPMIDSNAFPDTPMAVFWSATPVPNTTNMWLVDFGTGEMTKLSTTNSARVRCVKNK
jgi:hypothetical protein